MKELARLFLLHFILDKVQNSEMKWDSSSIKDLRAKKNLSQGDLAEILGCRQQTVSEWECGVYTPSKAYCRLLDQVETKPTEYSQDHWSPPHEHFDAALD